MTSILSAEHPPVRTSAGRGGFLAFAARSHGRACALLVAFALVSFLPGFVSLPPMDRDEPRFAQASKQMLERGDFVDIRFQDEARHKKPVGIYWLQTATVAAAEAVGVSNARSTIAVYRLPSLVGAIASVLLTYWAALAFVGRRGAFLAALLIAASLILAVEARLAKTDAVLTASAVAVLGGLARAYLGRAGRDFPRADAVVFWVAVAAGILVKGPLVPMFAGLAALVLSIRERSGRWLLRLRPWTGLALVLVLVAPWFAAIAWRSHGAFFAEAVGHDMLGKVGTAQVQHWAPPGTYLLAFFGTFWPGAALAAVAVPFAWRARSEDRVALALAWIVPSWLVFEAVPTKLPHYVLPLYPAVAILTALAITRGEVGPHRPGARAALLLVPSIPAGVAVALAGAAWSLDGSVPWQGLLVLVGSSLLGVGAWLLFRRGEIGRTVLAAAAASLLLSLGVFGFVQPRLESLQISPRLARLVNTLDCPEPEVGTLGYREPSLVFLAGTGTVLLDSAGGAAAFLARGGCRIAFVEKRFGSDFSEAAKAAGIAPTLAGRVAGFNINSGRRVDLVAYVPGP